MLAANRGSAWYKKRNYCYPAALKNLCLFIEDHVINEKKFFFFSFLQEVFSNFLIEEYKKNGLPTTGVFDTRHLRGKILSQETFKEKRGGRSIIGPFNFTTCSNLEALKEEDTLQRAANQLRNVILKMRKRTLPNEVETKDLVAGECDIPEILKTFFKTVLGGFNHQRSRAVNLDLRSETLCSDLIYATTRGRIKPAKQIELGIALKSLTNSKKVLNIINKLGHCISYSVIEELETEAAYTSFAKSSLCPSCPT